MKRQTLSQTIWILALGFGLSSSFATAAEFDHSHWLLDQVLKRHVKDALVDYNALKATPKDLNAYLDQLAAMRESEFKRWKQQEQIAFLLNAYNAFTLRLIIDHYPVKSIKDIGTFLKGPWDQPVVRLFGKTLTLATVEHQILRERYSEPRIHFAMVCAARGCPPLRAEAYQPDALDRQLDDQARQFLAILEKNRVNASERVVYLSPIFKWFAGDFEKKSGSVLAFLRPYFPEEPRHAFEKGGLRIKYTDYDWSLNNFSN